MSKLIVGLLLLSGACFKTETIQICDANCTDLASFDLPAMDLTPMCVDSTTCSADAPVCVSGICAGCTAGVDGGSASECATYHVATPLCGPSGACVECLTKDDCASAHQTCDVSAHSCAPCKMHSDCSSGACDPSGACVDAAMIAYVDQNRCAGQIPDGSLARPLCQVTDGVSAGKGYVVIAGSATRYSPVVINAVSQELFLIGPGKSASPTARIYDMNTCFTVNVVSASADVKVHLFGLDFGGQGTSKSTHGINCTNTSTANVALSVSNCLIHDSTMTGVGSNGCAFALDQSFVSANTGTGVNVSGGSLNIDACTIDHNGGGVSLTSTQYTITNSFITNSDSGTAGVSINDAASTGIFAFNTVAGNGGSLANVGGVICPSSGAHKLLENSIVALNSEDPASTGTQFAGVCDLQNVVTGTDSIASAGAIKMTPTFDSAFRISATDTCCVDKISDVTGIPNTNHDGFGNPRPVNGLWDIGADEVQ